MTRYLKLFLLCAFAATLGGCASNADPEERDFFYSGWMKPNKPPAQRSVSY